MARPAAKKVQPASKTGNKKVATNWNGTACFSGEDSFFKCSFARRVSVGEAVRLNDEKFASVVRVDCSTRKVTLNEIPKIEASMCYFGKGDKTFVPLFAVMANISH